MHYYTELAVPCLSPAQVCKCRLDSTGLMKGLRLHQPPWSLDDGRLLPAGVTGMKQTMNERKKEGTRKQHAGHERYLETPEPYRENESLNERAPPSSSSCPEIEAGQVLNISSTSCQIKPALGDQLQRYVGQHTEHWHRFIQSVRMYERPGQLYFCG